MPRKDDGAMERAVLVYTTCPSVVEARLAACANILPGMISHYWWEGKVERGEEVAMILKTQASLAAQVTAAIREAHSYTTPAILVLPVEGGDADYLAWIAGETRGPAGA